MIRVLENHKTEAYLNIKNRAINDLAYFWDESSTHGDDPSPSGKYENFGFYSHALIMRAESGSPFTRNNSGLVDVAAGVVEEILVSNNIKINYICRMTINCVHPTKSNKYSIPHVDHDFPHKNLLIYFTDSGGETVVESVLGNKKHYPKEDDVIMFDGVKHYHRPPKEGRRIVLVTTFV
tara:strand:- start:56 stop:592 length:537 start_codon:yes stop_codon:yes gene_type:complete